MTLRERAFENILGNGENARNQHFLLFLQCFPSYQGQFPSSWATYDVICFQFGRVTKNRLVQFIVAQIAGFELALQKQKMQVSHILNFSNHTFKGDPSNLGMKILQKYQKVTLRLPKPFNFHS